MNKPLHTLSKEAFAPYGELLEPDISRDHPFQIIVQEPDSMGWRIAISQLKQQPIYKLGRHSDSRESFEPLSGVSMIIVARQLSDEIEAFLLDRPVCLFKNIWHATTALSDRAVLKITENNHVSADEYMLPEAITIGVV
ncbi:MAG: hypothetical protein K0Q73_5610 [Paenibacillus sp.]|nr:hypothetical protein [Paenibacillus sp.]